MKKVLILLTFITLFSCKEEKLEQKTAFTKIETKTILSDSISIRALAIKNDTVWYAGNKGKYGAICLTNNTKFKGHIVYDSLKPEFRSIALSKNKVFVLSVGSPALLYAISKNKTKTELTYTLEHPNAFFDSMLFVNDSTGLAMGDPLNDELTVIKSIDFGKNWKQTKPNKNLRVTKGEAAFAASNTNLIKTENKVFMVSGGVQSRVFVSDDLGENWTAYPTPIIQGKAMTGIFTAAFYDDEIGIIAGGNYEEPKYNSANKAITTDGGKTWEIIAPNEVFGYSSCVQFVPKSNGNGIVSVGADGLFYSNNRGKRWEKLSDDAELYTIRFINENKAIAAGKNKIIAIDFL